MKKTTDEYRRTLSPEEVSEKRLMVMNDALKFFPKPFKKFGLKVAEETFEVAVEAVDCQCRGPAQPHQHYWLPVKEMLGKVRWERGAHITIRKENNAYTLIAV